jgi:hypothetical protein
MSPSDIPSGLRTLASTRPDTSVVVRSVLSDRTRNFLHRQRLDVGEPVRCLNVDEGGIWLETGRGDRVLMPWEHATAVQVQAPPDDRTTWRR